MNASDSYVLRGLALALMTGDNDISEVSYGYLRALLAAAGHVDIINAVAATDGRFYLPEDWDA